MAEIEDGWFPIETAPKDGTVIRAKNECMDFTVLGKWDKYISRFNGRVTMEWVIEKDEDKFTPLRRGTFFVPTMWQPVS